MKFTTNNRVFNWIFDRLFDHKLTKVTFHYERGYKDDEQIYESFVRQCIAEMRQMIDDLEIELTGESTSKQVRKDKL